MTKYNFGLIGYPVAHSLSPIIHKKALESFGLDGNYELFPIPPFHEGKEELLKLLAELKNGNLDGINITIPHKQNILDLMDQLSPSAKAIGAVNTIYVSQDKLVGDNTDAPGFLSALKQSQLIQEQRPKNSIVFGAGGSARAIVYALAKDGWTVFLASRRIEQAKELIRSIASNIPSPTAVFPIELASNSIEKIMNTCQILINTTPVGMSPKVDESPWPSELNFPTHLNVYDLIYHPKKTLLCKIAEKSGAKTSGGLGMLVEQASLSFELWTGKSPNRAILIEEVDTKL